MLLYHGSNVAVKEPKIITSNRTLDFGPGFYVTSDQPQAVRWAQLQTQRRRTGEPTVTVYELDEDAVAALSVMRFDHAGKEWLNYVAMNRKGIYSGSKYDMVIGPVANDNTMPVISDYMSGVISEKTALILLKPQKLADQFAFLTWKGLFALRLQEVRRYG